MWRLIKNGLLFSMLIIFIVITYIYFDPFKVIWSYNDYSSIGVIPNRDYVSTQIFLNKYKKYKYDSFVFGSSRTKAFEIKEWQKYLKKDNQSFMFDASGESLYGIYLKMKLIDSLNVRIENALFVFCNDYTFNNSYNINPSGILYRKHPILTNENKLQFQLKFLQSYLNPYFLYNFYLYKFSDKYYSTMKGYLENRHYSFDSISNQFVILEEELEINTDAILYYKKNNITFYKRDIITNFKKAIILESDILMLKKIRAILLKDKTKFKIILSPLYDQVEYNDNDLQVLNSIFGDNICNFTGKNNLTNNYLNYYETSHYRPSVGRYILKNIYN